jgi:hypothetical protein
LFHINTNVTSFFITSMDTEQLKKNFEEQLAAATKQITDLEESLAKAREYKIKLQGGLETLALLEDDGRQEPPAPEAE